MWFNHNSHQPWLLAMLAGGEGSWDPKYLGCSRLGKCGLEQSAFLLSSPLQVPVDRLLYPDLKAKFGVQLKKANQSGMEVSWGK